ncbi:MAG TPA: lycopene cyclase domain-containing protein [Prolixibacteraceae bacterium]|nr:lycopene cyclase domain-containing protein [Prolixibacteraceae bacterium]
MSLYTLLLLFSFIVPITLSFDRRLQFYRQWPSLLPAITFVAVIYIVADVLLTNAGVWGFNEQYHSGYTLLNLPVEEWLFFFVIPYASIFLHESLILYFPKLKVSQTVSKRITISLILFFLILLAFNTGRSYSSYIFAMMILVLLLTFFDRKQVVSSYFVTFLVILIPFLIVNSILTGSFIEGEVVWYNNDENLNIRIFTIPVEDVAYAFSMILYSLLIRNFITQFWLNRRI